VIFAAVYGLVVVVNFSSLITAIYMNSDAAIAPVIGKLLASAPPGSHVLLGNHPWYEDLWFLRATAGLPGYRQLWLIAPAAWTLLGFGLLAWSTWKVLGARAAAITFSGLVCLGAGGRSFFFSFDTHSLTALHTILLGVLLTWLAANSERLRAWQLSVIALGAGAISAAPVSGDTLFLPWALLPMLATSAVLAWRTRSPAQWKLLAVAVGITAVALVGGDLLREAAQHSGWRYYNQHVSFVMANHLLSNFVLLGQSFLYLAGGEFLGQGIHFQSDMVLASGALMAVALIALPFELRRRVSAAAPAPVQIDPKSAGRLAYILFWSFGLLLSSAAYLFSTAAVNVASARYLLAGYIAIAALLPLLAARTRAWHASVAVGVCVFALIASYQVVRKPFQPPTAPSPARATELLRLARYEHVDYGYASYWDAADLTWLTHFGLKVYPVFQCVPHKATICWFDLVRVDSWYRPRPNTRSMLIVDRKIKPLLVSGPDPVLGTPSLVTTRGHLQVFIYPYDIAARFYHTPVPR
jgi:hypothetical protein